MRRLRESCVVASPLSAIMLTSEIYPREVQQAEIGPITELVTSRYHRSTPNCTADRFSMVLDIFVFRNNFIFSQSLNIFL